MAPRKAHRHSSIAKTTTSAQGTDDQFNETKRWDRRHPGQDAGINLAKPEGEVGRIHYRAFLFGPGNHGEWHRLHLQPARGGREWPQGALPARPTDRGNVLRAGQVTSTSNNPISLAGLLIIVTAFAGSVPSTAKLRICADGAGNVAFETQVTLIRVKDVVTFAF
jgi:hypothetical protein